MRAKVEPAKLENLLALFEDTIQPEDIIYAKIASQASKYITKERLRLNMNQKEFADHIHATQSLVSRWESGKYNFSLKKLSEIAVSLDMDLHVYMTPRCAERNINITSNFTPTSWINVTYNNLPKTSILPKVMFWAPSTQKKFVTFSKPKEVISC